MNKNICGNCTYYCTENDGMFTIGYCSKKFLTPYRNASARACRKFNSKEFNTIDKRND